MTLWVQGQRLREDADYEAYPVERRRVEFLQHEVERFVHEATA